MRAQRFFKLYQDLLKTQTPTDAVYSLYLAMVKEMSSRLPKISITEGSLNGVIESYNDKWNYCARRDDRIRKDGFRTLCLIKLRPLIESARKRAIRDAIN